MSAEDIQHTVVNDEEDEVEEVNQGDMETGAVPIDDEEKVEGDVPMEDSNAEGKNYSLPSHHLQYF